MLKKRIQIIYALVLVFIVHSDLIGQERETIAADTILVEESVLKPHSPTKASLFSAVIPGLGQVYNKKYWKVPIIYAGLGAFTYYALEQHQLFDEKKTAYLGRIGGDTNHSDQYMDPGNFYSDASLLESLEINKRNRDLMIILDLVVYVLQIVDASVDAHLFYFNVSDDLSLHYRPNFLFDDRTGKATGSLTVNLHF